MVHRHWPVSEWISYQQILTDFKERWRHFEHLRKDNGTCLILRGRYNHRQVVVIGDGYIYQRLAERLHLVIWKCSVSFEGAFSDPFNSPTKPKMLMPVLEGPCLSHCLWLGVFAMGWYQALFSSFGNILISISFANLLATRWNTIKSWKLIWSVFILKSICLWKKDSAIIRLIICDVSPTVSMHIDMLSWLIL